MSALFNEWFWQERFWLPQNVTWADLRDTKDAQFAQPYHLLFVLPYSILLFLFRLVVERFVAKPIGKKLEISDAASKAPSENILLEKVFKSITTNPSGERLQGLSKQLDWSESKIIRWFKRKRDINRPTKLVKFQETVWRFLLYTFLFVFGNITLHHTSPLCLTQPRTCWEGYPDKQQLNSFNYWYFQIELSFYTSCAITQFFDVKRKIDQMLNTQSAASLFVILATLLSIVLFMVKPRYFKSETLHKERNIMLKNVRQDFWPMCIHHFATIFLIAFSYSINMLNIGAAIMVLHDFSDIFLEVSKIVKYAKCDALATIGFMSFGFCFFVARIIYFPFWILNSVWTDCFDMVGPFPSYYMFNVCLLLLQLLHIYWISFIIKGLIAFIRAGGGNVDDARSESEASDSSEVGDSAIGSSSIASSTQQ